MLNQAYKRYLVLALAVQALLFAAAQEAPVITWTVSTTGEDLPEETAPGYTVFTVNSDSGSDTGYTVTVFRLKEGATLEAFQEATAAIDRALNGEGDPVEAINAGLELAEVVGEAVAEAGATGSFGAVLEAGTYVLDGSPNNEDGGGMPERVYQTLTVSGEPQAEAPQTDQTVQMVEFAFAFPPDIQAGEQMWQVTNSGQQLHHMVLFRLADGKTMEDFTAWNESQEGPPPGEQAGYVGIMSPGRSQYVALDLTPGEYVAMCFMPDHRGDATGTPHFMLGMMQNFTIAGE